MNPLAKFVVLFLVSYSVIIFIADLEPVKAIINNSFRSLVESSVKIALPDAFIETQDYFDKNRKSDINVFHLVYGNPAVIKAETDLALKQKLKEYRISTYSINFYIFQMLTVPLVFLISLFISTPIDWKTMVKSTGIGIVLLLLLILFKCILFSMYSIANSKIGIYEMSDSTLSFLNRTVVVLSLGFSVIYVFSLWLILGFRKSIFLTQFNQFIKNFQS
jgi:hypothetical protein